MGRVAKILIAAGVVAGIGFTAGQGALAERGMHPFDRELLETHNEARKQFGSKPLRWNEELADQAYDYAKVLAQRGRMEHSPNSARRGVGENLWQGTERVFSGRQMVQMFVDEQRYFRPGKFPNVSSTGQWKDVGHYTQVVWPWTEEVGCAVAGNGRDDFLVCRYRPTGNIVGWPVGQ
ncbi:CAP family protein [Erythrobacter sp. HKB08]|uniref:CAP family protein n=1 Tax=Erythrobacter sp. HKB08 TaxID=2502843 RepID=UPI0010092D37|nr:CAP family protein [Erythrobacter sp. HKB08]